MILLNNYIYINMIQRKNMIQLKNAVSTTAWVIGFALIFLAANTINRVILSIFVAYTACTTVGLVKCYGVDLQDSMLLFFSILCSLSIFLSLGVLMQSSGIVVYRANSNDINMACHTIGLGSMEHIALSGNKICNIHRMHKHVLNEEYEMNAIPDEPVLMGFVGTRSDEHKMRVVSCRDAGVHCYRPYISIESESNHTSKYSIPLALIRKITIKHARNVFVVYDSKFSYTTRHIDSYVNTIHLKNSSFLQFNSPLHPEADALRTDSHVKLPLHLLENSFLMVVSDNVDRPIISLRRNCKSTTVQCPRKRRLYESTMHILGNTAVTHANDVLCAIIRLFHSGTPCTQTFLLFICNVLIPVCIMCTSNELCKIQTNRSVLAIFILVLLIMSLNYIILVSIVYGTYTKNTQKRIFIVFVKFCYTLAIACVFLSGDFTVQKQNLDAVIFVIIPSVLLHGRFYVVNIVVNFTVTLFSITIDLLDLYRSH
jgi:hypothetical protein